MTTTRPYDTVEAVSLDLLRIRLRCDALGLEELAKCVDAAIELAKIQARATVQTRSEPDPSRGAKR